MNKVTTFRCLALFLFVTCLINVTLNSWGKDVDTAGRKKQCVALRSDNVDEVVAELKRSEKIRLLVGSGWGSLFAGFNIPLAKGVVPGAAGQSRGIKRLGIPPLVFADGPAGLRLKRSLPSTGFPVGTVLAASNDTALVRQVGEAIAEEALHYGIDVVLTPGMNLMRNPLCGRNYEYFSEDPDLTAQMATAIVRGVQSRGVGACIKHFACNNQEFKRFDNDVRIDTAILREVYLRPFLKTIRESNPWTLMSSYNWLNGERTQESKWLLNEVLRQEWGYQGVVMTDWTGVRRSAKQIEASNDILMPGMKRQRWQIKRAIKRGRLSEETVDSAVHRILSLVVKTRKFSEEHAGQQQSGKYDLLLDEHARVARRAAAMGMVVLENRDETLPLRLHGQCIALYGSSSYEMVTGGIGSGHVHGRYTIQMPSALQNEGAKLCLPISKAYQHFLGRRKRISHRKDKFYMSKFLGKNGPKEAPMDSMFIQKHEPETDVAIITLSRPSGEGQDRKIKDDFLLNKREQQLIDRVSAIYHRAGKKVIVVLNVCGPIEVVSWRNKVDAILCAWLPGQEAGAAVCDVLSGRVRPHSRLPMTWPVSVSDLPSSKNFPAATGSKSPVTNYDEGADIGYRFYQHSTLEPAYPFGYQSR